MQPNVIHDGSMRQLWRVSSGLMISFFSMMAMMFVDRLFLSYYSTAALGAATSAGTLFHAGNLMWVTLVAIAEVFVAQYNGAKEHHKMGEPVWQMIYLSLIGALFFFALGSVGSDYFLSIGLMHQGEVDYFRWCNYFAPCMTLLTALSAFYIGQGKTAVIQWLALIGNVVNIALDPLFIFGYKNYVPSMGIKGAAIATGIGMAVQMVILGILFLKKKNRTLFGTGNYAFRLKPFLKCLKVGASPAIFVMFELLGWGIFYKLMERVSNTHLLIASITQSVLILFLFFGLGLEKGAAAVSGNLIGAKKLSEVTRLFRSGMKLVFLFTAFLVVTLGIFPDFFIDLFFKNPEALSTALVDISATTLVEIKQTLRFALVLLIVYMTFENVRWLLSGLLTSAGDTFYLLVTGAISIWAFMLVPTYFLVVKVKGPIEIALYIWLFYAAVSMALLYFRFKQGKWKNKEVIDSTSTEISAEPS